MDANLVGYLLEALEPEERVQVENELRDNPEAQERLRAFKLTIEPLALDDHSIDPPADLWVRTLGRVAAYQCQKLPHAPASPISRSLAAPKSIWRRADILVAASLLICATLLVPPGLNYLRYRQALTACQNNLRTLYTALDTYTTLHDGNYPNIAEAAPEPRNVAGLFIPILNQDQLLPPNVSIACPGMGSQPPQSLSVRDVEQMKPEEFGRYLQNLTGCYAYTLGYADDKGVHGLRFDPEQPNHFLPILADRPPDGISWGDGGNSPNHGGFGQNVLFLDGHCSFCTNRAVGVNGDDIYLNEDKKVAAGKHLCDAVLGTSSARP